MFVTTCQILSVLDNAKLEVIKSNVVALPLFLERKCILNPDLCMCDFFSSIKEIIMGPLFTFFS